MSDAQWVTLWSLAGGALAAGVLRGLEWWLNRSVRVLATRKDSREELAELWKENRLLRTEAEDWRARYHAAQEKASELDLKVDDLTSELARCRPKSEPA